MPPGPRGVLRLLLWKNAMRHIREPMQMAFSMSSVLLMCGTLVLLRILRLPEGFTPTYHYPSYKPDYLPPGRIPHVDALFNTSWGGDRKDPTCLLWEKGEVLGRRAFTDTSWWTNLDPDNLDFTHPQIKALVSTLDFTKIDIPKHINVKFLLDLLDEGDIPLEELLDLFSEHGVGLGELIEKHKWSIVNASTTALQSHRKEISGALKKVLEIPSLKRWIVVWSPYNSLTKAIMDDAMKLTPFIGCGVENSSIAMDLLTRSQAVPQEALVLAAVAFPDDITRINPDFTVTIRFPGQTRYIWDPNTRQPIDDSFSRIRRNWNTLHVFPWLYTQPKDPHNKAGGHPGYLHEGFLGIQDAISRAVVQYYNRTLNGSIPAVNVRLQRFPDQARFVDAKAHFLFVVVFLSLPIAYITLVVAAARSRTAEKETHFTGVLKMLGVKTSLNGFAWFLDSMLLFTVASVVVTAIGFKFPGFAVLPNSDCLCIFVLLLAYSAAAVSFSYFASSFFDMASNAATGANALWALSGTIFFWLETADPNVSYNKRLYFGLSPNVAVMYAFKTVQTFEGLGKGLQWDNMYSRVPGSEDVPINLSIQILLADALLYWLAAQYIETIFPGSSGIGRPWHFPVSQFFGERNLEHPILTPSAKRDEVVEEPEPADLPVGIGLKNLKKVFGKGLIAVNDLTFNVFQGQITILLGHNGAGKTTTMSMLTGLLAPTEGTVSIRGHDLSTNPTEARRCIGYCPQHNVLLEHLTVEEHLYIFARLKCVSEENILKGMNKYAKLMDLQDKMDVLARDLSGGWKRKLSVALALIGDSPVVILDEPTSGMDAEARRSLWGVLQQEKANRAILLTTHYMDEADVLGDRVVMISSGRLHCVGSSFYLKNKLGRGYRLVMVKNPQCSTIAVLSVLKKHIPDTMLSSDLGTEMTFELPRHSADTFAEAFEEIEQQKKSLGVNCYGISSANLEDVLIATIGRRRRASSVTFVDDLCEEEETEVPTTGFGLLLQQMWALFSKRWILLFRNRTSFCFWMTYPATVAAMTIVVIRMWQGTRDLPPRLFTLKDYPEGYVAAEIASSSGMFEAFKNFVLSQKIVVHSVSSVTDFFLHQTIHQPLTTFRQFVFGLKIDADEITGIYNTVPFHAAPLALQTAYNTILQNYVNSTVNINFVNHPQPYSPLIKSIIHQQGANVSHAIGSLVCCTFFHLAAWCIAFYVRERSCRSKLLQLTAGVSPLTYWASSLLADFIFVGMSVAIFAITIFCFQEEGLDTAADAGRIVLLQMTFFFAILSFGAVSTFLVDDGAALQMRFNVILSFAGPFAYNVINSLGVLEVISMSTWERLGWYFRWLPSFAVIEAIGNLSRIHWLRNFCQPIFNKFCGKQNDFNHSCCKGCLSWVEDPFDMTVPGVGENIAMMLLFGLASLLILLLIEMRYLSTVVDWFRRSYEWRYERSEDADVVKERKIADSAELSPSENKYNLIVRGMSKYYENRKVVDGVSLAIKPGECFGLLGINGAGKTTTFKMLTGDVRPCAGDAFIQGYSVVHNKSQAYRRFGYCPQFDGLLNELTGRETLRLYCRLRGVPVTKLEMTCERMARQLLFYQHIDKQVKEYSGGNKRKLSTAVALIGDPAVIFLDEPTSGMDTLAKRYFWDVICRVRDQGKTIVLTSHSLEECEALCSRVAVMASGRLLCIGSPQHLKNRYSRQFILTAKLHAQSIARKQFHAAPKAAKLFFKHKLPDAILAREQVGLLTYHIPTTSGVTWSQMFKVATDAKEGRYIEDFALDQSSLEEVFLSLATTNHSKNKLV